MSRILDNELMGDEELVERTLRPQPMNWESISSKLRVQLLRNRAIW